jgi:Histidine kinase-, DNA gyrase B-, and HSP90-like ATPase.
LTLRPQVMTLDTLNDQAMLDVITRARTLPPGGELEIDTSHVSSVYPNGAVPLAAAIDYFNSHAVSVSPGKQSTQVQKTHLFNPMTVDKFVRYETPLTHNVWKYRNEEEAQKLADKFVEALVDQVPCENGVVDTFNWCLYEVMDNVFQHSGADAGFVMMQLQRKSRRCVLAIADTGGGIQRSLAVSSHGGVDRTQIKDARNAIGYAVQQGVTSKGKLNQGNGLYGLARATEINGGRLRIVSGRGIWCNDPHDPGMTDLARPVLDPENHQATLVDWQLDCASPVRIEEALGKTSPTESFIENIEAAEGFHRIGVLEIEEALGSRAKGSEVRTRLVNYLAAGAEIIVLDFTGVGVISSSFADEVLGKLAVDMGELDFRRRIFVDSASPTNRSLIERAISLRLQSGV